MQFKLHGSRHFGCTPARQRSLWIFCRVDRNDPADSNVGFASVPSDPLLAERSNQIFGLAPRYFFVPSPSLGEYELASPLYWRSSDTSSKINGETKRAEETKDSRAWRLTEESARKLYFSGQGRGRNCFEIIGPVLSIRERKFLKMTAINVCDNDLRTVARKIGYCENQGTFDIHWDDFVREMGWEILL